MGESGTWAFCPLKTFAFPCEIEKRALFSTCQNLIRSPILDPVPTR
jgi:hypothetical protein